jgi:hypothetical protein
MKYYKLNKKIMKNILWIMLSLPFFIIATIIYGLLIISIYLAFLFRCFDIWYANYEIKKFINTIYE